MLTVVEGGRGVGGRANRLLRTGSMYTHSSNNISPVSDRFCVDDRRPAIVCSLFLFQNRAFPCNILWIVSLLRRDRYFSQIILCKLAFGSFGCGVPSFVYVIYILIVHTENVCFIERRLR